MVGILLYIIFIIIIIFQDHSRSSSSFKLWIGATDDIVENTWLWYGIDKPLAQGYTNWAHNQPDNGEGDHDEDCVCIRSSDWKWHDYSCHEKMFYACEKPYVLKGQCVVNALHVSK